MTAPPGAKWVVSPGPATTYAKLYELRKSHRRLVRDGGVRDERVVADVRPVGHGGGWSVPGPGGWRWAYRRGEGAPSVELVVAVRNHPGDVVLWVDLVPCDATSRVQLAAVFPPVAALLGGHGDPGPVARERAWADVRYAHRAARLGEALAAFWRRHDAVRRLRELEAQWGREQPRVTQAQRVLDAVVGLDSGRRREAWQLARLLRLELGELESGVAP